MIATMAPTTVTSSVTFPTLEEVLVVEVVFDVVVVVEVVVVDEVVVGAELERVNCRKPEVMDLSK
ncbi:MULTISPECIES: hypothetical protein, partial [Metallosphaera]|uniref:hypothetical protein n=1 Tax=Metallosphaera TaxID=41980 RepID=UPI002989DDAF